MVVVSIVFLVRRHVVPIGDRGADFGSYVFAEDVAVA